MLQEPVLTLSQHSFIIMLFPVAIFNYPKKVSMDDTISNLEQQIVNQGFLLADMFGVSRIPATFVTDRAGKVQIGYREMPDGPMQAVEALLDTIAREAAGEFVPANGSVDLVDVRGPEDGCHPTRTRRGRRITPSLRSTRITGRARRVSGAFSRVK